MIVFSDNVWFYHNYRPVLVPAAVTFRGDSNELFSVLALSLFVPEASTPEAEHAWGTAEVLEA